MYVESKKGIRKYRYMVYVALITKFKFSKLKILLFSNHSAVNREQNIFYLFIYYCT